MIKLQNVSKTYSAPGGGVTALQGLCFEMEPGGFTAITGPSGSGKTTLMNIIGCLDIPSEGEYYLAGQNVGRLDSRRLSGLRNRQIGFVFQNFNLISTMTALENVELPLIIRGISRQERRKIALEALEAVGLAERVHQTPGRLSGGQQQRVAIARVIACKTPLILADEPTGNLDSSSGQAIMDILRTLNAEGTSILLITHDDGVASMAKERYHLDNGCLSKKI